jgi:hypothetical protein
MSETATDNQMPAGQSDQAGQTNQPAAAHTTKPGGMEIMYESTASPAEVGATPDDTAREVAARHLGRLLYAPVNTWSRYVFHENDPHPFAPSRPIAGRA